MHVIATLERGKHSGPDTETKKGRAELLTRLGLYNLGLATMSAQEFAIATSLQAPLDIIAICVQHSRAIRQSIQQQELGYIADVEVTADVVNPAIVGEQQMAAMGNQRRVLDRDLVRHPDNNAQMVIVARKIGYTSTR